MDERKIGPYYVDGYAEIDRVRHALEFQECFFHGCPSCYQQDNLFPFRGAPFRELHIASEYKLQRLISEHNVQVTEMMEHDWAGIVKMDPRVQQFLKDCTIPEPFEPREALCIPAEVYARTQ